MNYLILIELFILGSILGSFYGVVSTRLPLGLSIIKPNSHCEYCNHELKWYELIPIFSFISKRKVLTMSKKLSWTYPIIEISTGLLFALSYYHFGWGCSFFISLILSSLLILIFISDIKYMIILDSPLIISGIAIFLLKWYYFDISTALLSLATGLGSFLTMFAIGKLGDFLFKRESLGGGDIKLSFIFGMTLGFKMSIMALVLSTFLALPYAFACLFLKKDHEVPFGPFLIGALWLVFFFLDKFQNIFIFLTTI